MSAGAQQAQQASAGTAAEAWLELVMSDALNAGVSPDTLQVLSRGAANVGAGAAAADKPVGALKSAQDLLRLQRDAAAFQRRCSQPSRTWAWQQQSAVDVEGGARKGAFVRPRHVNLPLASMSASASSAGPAPVAATPFQEWLAAVRADACSGGVSAGTVDQALAGVVEPPGAAPQDSVATARSTTQLRPSWNPSQSVRRYVQRLVPERVEVGAAKLREHAALLRSIEADFGVPPEVTVAIWGIETSYGCYTGSSDVIQALMTHGFEERGTPRGDWIRSEIVSALLMLDRGHVQLADFRGSHAGAVGQCQFMPSNYFVYAVDYDGDGKADIWHSEADALASIGSFLKGHGYVAGQSYGVLAELPDEQLQARDCAAITAACRGGSFPPLRDIPSSEMKYSQGSCMTATQWREAGAKLLCDGNVPDDCLLQCVALDEGEGRLALLAGPSSRAILRYNPSQSYVAAVVHLANSISEASCSSVLVT